MSSLRASVRSGGVAALLLGLLTSAQADPIQDSIQRGVKALKVLHEKPHVVVAGNRKAGALLVEANKHPVGILALQGLTFLECDVPATDPLMQNAIQLVRNGSIELRGTYSLSLAILFLDRLGNPADVPLIQALGRRLALGQNVHGGWSYDCPPPSRVEVQQLSESVRSASSSSLSAAPKPEAPAPEAKPGDEKKGAARQGVDDFLLGGVGDNSNTQFAALGLWTARKHGVDVSKSFKLLEARFRQSQRADGGWGYLPGMPSTPAMTCAGLMTVAMCDGMLREQAQKAGKAPPLLANDRNLHGGLQALGGIIGTNPGKGRAMYRGHYFLWSLERLTVGLGLQTLGKRDWYAWGAELLVTSQSPDGYWWGEHGPGVDTCFALLFLRRANMTKDLTVLLKGVAQDPGSSVLKGGGVGGQALLGKGMASDIVLQDEQGGPPQVALPAGLDPEAARLGQELLQAPPAQQPGLIDKLQQAKGIENTDALAAAIPHLRGELQTKARDALAERLTRMTAATLRGKLAETDVEVRVASIQACVNKEALDLVPDLIALLDDGTERVARAAYRGLKYLTGQDFGPPAGAAAGERARAMTAWKTWWQKQTPK